MITYPQLTMALLYDMSWRWSLYLNRCMALSHSEYVGVHRATVTFSLEPTLLYMKGGSYLGPLLMVTLAEMIIGRCGGGSGGNGSGNGSSGRSSGGGEKGGGAN